MMVYLSGVSMVGNHFDWSELTVADLGILDPLDVYLTSSLVNSRPVWNCHPLAQIELDLLASLLMSQLSASIG